MQVMLTNRGTTPLPIGSPDGAGYEGLLPPGLEIALARDDLTTLVFGEQPEAAGRNKRHALRDVDPDSPLAIEYGTDIDQWKGRSDPDAEKAEMRVWLFIRNVGRNEITITTPDGPTAIPAGGDGVEIYTNSGTLIEGTNDAPIPPEPPPFVPVTSTITAFSAANPSVATADTTGLASGDKVRLTATAGDATAQAIVTGSLVTVADLTATSFTATGLNLEPNDVTGLTATGATEAPPSADVGQQHVPINPNPGGATTGTPAPAPVPAPAPAPAAPPPWTIRNITSLNPVMATVDDATGLNQGDYLTFTVVEGTQAQKDAINGQGGQVQSLNGNTIQIGYNGSAAGDPTGIVMTGAR